MNRTTKDLLLVTGIVSTLALIGYGMAKSVFKDPHPSKFTVMITNLEETGGGSGSVIKTSKTKSQILTNEHVCSGIKGPGKVKTTDGQSFLITGKKVSTAHDLCIIEVNADLGAYARIADKAPNKFDKALVIGHPNLLPTTMSDGKFGGLQVISVMVGVRECTSKDMKNEGTAVLCLIFGALPIINTYEAQVVSALIMPGSSGSAVLNEDGEIAGVAFAGNGRGLSYAYIVPVQYVINFINNDEFKLDLDILSIVPKYTLQSKCTLQNKVMSNKVEEFCHMLETSWRTAF